MTPHLILLLCLVLLGGCAGRADYSALEGRENVVVTRIAFKRAVDEKSEQEKNILQKLNIDGNEWNIDTVHVCFSDGLKESCTKQDEFDIRMNRYNRKRAKAITFKTPGQSLALTRIVLLGRRDTYGFKFSPPPKVIFSNSGGIYYIGDILINVVEDKSEKTLSMQAQMKAANPDAAKFGPHPKLELSVHDGIDKFSPEFTASIGFPPGTAMQKRILPAEGLKYSTAMQQRR
jgi:hypothetical protein